MAGSSSPVLRKHPGENVGRGGTSIGLPTRQHLEQDAPERPNIRTLVNFLPSRLFGRHVGGSTEDDPLLRRRHAQRW